MKVLLACLLSALPGSAPMPGAAQALGFAETELGVATLRRVDGVPVLEVAGQSFRLEPYANAAFLDRLGTLQLIRVESGGTMCPAEYLWLDAAPGRIRITEIFGTCSDLAEVTWDSASVRVIMPSLDPSEGKVAFIWDGKGAEVQRQVLGPARSGLPPGAPVVSWEGRRSSEFLAAPDWHALLVELMGPDALADALDTIQLGEPFHLEGDWMVGTGCRPHQCDERAGAVALHRADGRVMVALVDAEQGVRFWGDRSGDIPPGVQAILNSSAPSR